MPIPFRLLVWGRFLGPVAIAPAGHELPRLQEAKPRNIVFILVDDQRWDALSCLGHPFLETPNADAIAARGVRFASAYEPSIRVPLLMKSPDLLPQGTIVEEIAANIDMDKRLFELLAETGGDSIPLHRGWKGSAKELRDPDASPWAPFPDSMMNRD